MPFQPTRPGTSYEPTALEQSVTIKNTSIRYDPSVLKPGTPGRAVKAAFGEPNAWHTDDNGNGQLADVYAFNPDGTKFVHPDVRPRNLALAFFTLGASVAVRQARLYMAERKLALYHVYYAPQETIGMVDEEKMSAAPKNGPQVGTGSSPGSATGSTSPAGAGQ